MEFLDKKEEFIYFSMKCQFAKELNDKEMYLFCLEKAKELLEEIEEENK